MDILILGGTSWLGGLIAAGALERGHAVTCLARSEAGEPPAGASYVRADRTSPDAYAAVARPWDCVVDLSRDPAQASSALSALASSATHWIFVSTVSVYADHTSGTEADPLHQPFSGPGAPQPVAQPVQVIDAEDLATWLVDAVEHRISGTYDAVGGVTTIAGVLEACSTHARFSPVAVEADPAWLEANGVAPWSGPRSLPLWLPGEDQPMMTRSGAAARAAGLASTPLARTVASTLTWEESLGLLRERRAGLSPEEERDLLSELFAR